MEEKKMNQLYVIGILIALAASFGFGCHYGSLNSKLTTERQNNKEYEANEIAGVDNLKDALKAEEEKEARRAESNKRNERLNHAIKTSDTSDVRMSDDSLRAINEARALTNRSSE